MGIRLVALATVSLMLLVGVASADTSSHTRLSIRANKTAVKKGERVRISGSLSSRDPDCRRDQLISLKDQGGADRTGRRGVYSFSVKVNKTTTFKTSFGGATPESIRTRCAARSPTPAA